MCVCMYFNAVHITIFYMFCKIQRMCFAFYVLDYEPKIIKKTKKQTNKPFELNASGDVKQRTCKCNYCHPSNSLT